MPSLPLPERGQPFDVTYVYNIVQSINELYSQIGISKKGYTSLTTTDSGPQQIKTSEAQIDLASVRVSTSSLQTAGTSLPWYHDFKKEFRYDPIVTATAYNRGNSDAGKDITVTINSITPSRVEGSVKFNLGGETTVSINVIAVGQPNS